jgi:hypothetical protein
MSQINPVNTSHPISFRTILIIFSQHRPGLPIPHALQQEIYAQFSIHLAVRQEGRQTREM